MRTIYLSLSRKRIIIQMLYHHINAVNVLFIRYKF